MGSLLTYRAFENKNKMVDQFLPRQQWITQWYNYAVGTIFSGNRYYFLFVLI